MSDTGQGLALLREKLDTPEASAATARLIDRMDALEASVSRMSQLLEEAPRVLAATTDIADEAIRDAGRRGVDVEERARGALSLLERLTEPSMMAALDRLLDLAQGSEAALAMMGDMADDAARRLDVPQRAQAGGALLEKATRPEVVSHLDQMFDTLMHADGGMLSPEAVDTLGKAAQALVEARSKPPRRVTPWQAFRAARDPQLQRALGFLLEFGEQFARRLDQ